MSRFLFVVEVPPNKAQSSPAGYPHEWTTFLSDIESKLGNAIGTPKTAKTYTRIQQNVWLIHAENSWQLLSILSANAESHNLAYSTLLLSGDVTPMMPTAK